MPDTDTDRDGDADIAVVLGTRPEVIKLAPVIRALGSRARLIWTGQHYDVNLADVFFAGAGLEMPVDRLSGVGGEPRGDQIVAVLTVAGPEPWWSRAIPTPPTRRPRRPTILVYPWSTSRQACGLGTGRCPRRSTG
jgi:hypothetical protein